MATWTVVLEYALDVHVEIEADSPEDAIADATAHAHVHAPDSEARLTGAGWMTSDNHVEIEPR
jgi:hypothetical protein